MRNGWTGGQYSVVRGVFGLWLLLGFVRAWWASAAMASMQGPSALYVAAFFVVGALLAALLAVGAWPRVAALLLFAMVCWGLASAGRHVGDVATPGLFFTTGLLLAHALVPPAPYGSWTARGADDPGSGWRMPDGVITASWIVLALGFSYVGWGALGTPLVFLLAPLALVRPLRPLLWTAALVVHLGLRPQGTDSSTLMLLALAFDPAWIAANRTSGTSTIFYDGGCGLCHRAVRFALAEDRDGAAFRFAPLDSETFRAVVPETVRGTLPDSIVLLDADATPHVRSDAILTIGARLGGLWRLLAMVVAAMPRPLRDAAYDGVARVRLRLFARPTTACPLLPPHLRQRFLA